MHGRRLVGQHRLYYAAMFESIYSIRGVRAHRSKPLATEREEFLAHVQNRGVNDNSLRIYAKWLIHIVQFLRLKRLRPVTRAEILAAAREWATHKRRNGPFPPGPESVTLFIWLAERWLQFHRKLIVPQRRSAFDYELHQYVEFMRSERRLAPMTIKDRLGYARRFLTWLRTNHAGLRLGSISLRHLDRYFIAKSKGWSKATWADSARGLKAFFVYAESRHLCRRGIASGIKGPTRQTYWFEPCGPKWSEVLKLIDSAKGSGSDDIRAKAILMLLAFYALRRGEIVRLRLVDFGERSRIFTVWRSKYCALHQFPLREDVHRAVRDYIENARPQSSSENLFISFRPPFALIHPTLINRIVISRMRKLGIEARHRGPHSLRHACATELLRRGVPLRDIADFLGHKTDQTVRIYAKFSTQALKEVSNLDLTQSL